MPFANMSPDPGDEYFADGMTEELISTMSRIEQFEVISRTSVMQFKKNPKPIREVSRELDAGTVLEGSVRKAGNKLRVTVQMIDAAKDRHTWAESYDRELRDVFYIQSEISKAVAEELKVRILPSERARLEKEPTANTEAYKLFLKGRYHWNMRTKDEMQRAVQFFTDAIRIDPSYARAYYGLADCYIVLENWGFIKPEEAFAKYRVYAAKAVELDPSLAEAHVMLAAIKTSKEWDIEGAERELKRAIELDPNSSLAHQRYGFSLLGPQGRHKEALSELREAARLDPLSPMIASNVGDELLLEDRYEEAEKHYRNILDTRPDFPYAHARLGLTLLKESRYDEGIAEIEKARNLSKDPWGIVSDLILAYAVAGRRDDSERLLAELEQRSKQEYISNVLLAMANAAAGKDDRAIELLRKAEAEKSNQLRVNLGEPHFDKIRPDPRFQRVMKTVGH
jgi:TolB-like protein/Flp pilus assembly protein TadD